MKRGKNGQFQLEYKNDNNTINTSLALPREHKLNCKLNDKQIREIQSLYATGKFSSRQLGAEYGVSHQQILYWVGGDSFRKKESKRRKNYVMNDPDKPKRIKLYRNRLKKLIPDMALKERVRQRKARGLI